MSEQLKTDERQRANGSQADPIPGIDVRELVEEGNWLALGGLVLVGLGVLHLLGSIFAFSFNLWGVMLLGVGGWLVYDAWQKYENNNQTWVENTRNRMLAGAIVLLVGAMGLFDFSLWGATLLCVAGWLGYEGWQRYEHDNQVWTDYSRHRVITAVVLGIIGLFGLINVGSALPLILIVIGAVMLYRHLNG